MIGVAETHVSVHSSHHLPPDVTLGGFFGSLFLILWVFGGEINNLK